MEVACSNHAGDVMKCKWYKCYKPVPELTLTGLRSKALFCGQICANKYGIDRIRHTHKVAAVSYLGGKCETCGYVTCVAALEFSHKDSSTKLFSLSMVNLGIHSWDEITQELDKCQLLCANCRRELNYLEYQNRYLEH